VSLSARRECCSHFGARNTDGSWTVPADQARNVSDTYSVRGLSDAPGPKRNARFSQRARAAGVPPELTMSADKPSPGHRFAGVCRLGEQPCFSSSLPPSAVLVLLLWSACTRLLYNAAVSLLPTAKSAPPCRRRRKAEVERKDVSCLLCEGQYGYTTWGDSVLISFPQFQELCGGREGLPAVNLKFYQLLRHIDDFLQLLTLGISSAHPENPAITLAHYRQLPADFG
jgi:hypothetical protein